MRIPLGNFTNTIVARTFAVLLCTTLFANVSLSQKTIETSKSELPTTRTSEVDAPEPIFMSGNPVCADLNASSEARLSHIIDDFGLKIDEGSPNYANVPFNNGNNPSRQLQGGAAQDLTRTVSMSTTGNIFNWSSTKQITAVIVKGGPDGANVYPYNPFSFGGIDGGGTGLVVPGGGNAVSHVVFCFGLQLVPSSSNASVSGRVLDIDGNPIRGATLQMWNVSRGEYSYAYSNNFGYYTVTDLPVSDFYVLTVSHGRYSFFDNTRSFTLNDDIAGIDFQQSF